MPGKTCHNVSIGMTLQMIHLLASFLKFIERRQSINEHQCWYGLGPREVGTTGMMQAKSPFRRYIVDNRLKAALQDEEYILQQNTTNSLARKSPCLQMILGRY